MRCFECFKEAENDRFAIEFHDYKEDMHIAYGLCVDCFIDYRVRVEKEVKKIIKRPMTLTDNKVL